MKVMALDAPAPGTKQWFGLLEGQYQIPDDFDTLFQEEIEAAFYGQDRMTPLEKIFAGYPFIVVGDDPARSFAAGGTHAWRVAGDSICL